MNNLDKKTEKGGEGQQITNIHMQSKQSVNTLQVEQSY